MFLFLVSVGMSLIFGVTRIINLANGSLHIVGVSILEKGMVRYHGWMAEFLADDEVRQAYLAL